MKLWDKKLPCFIDDNTVAIIRNKTSFRSKMSLEISENTFRSRWKLLKGYQEFIVNEERRTYKEAVADVIKVIFLTDNTEKENCYKIWCHKHWELYQIAKLILSPKPTTDVCDDANNRIRHFQKSSR